MHSTSVLALQAWGAGSSSEMKVRWLRLENESIFRRLGETFHAKKLRWRHASCCYAWS